MTEIGPTWFPNTIVGHDDVVSVFPDSVLELHTTRSWDFIQEAGAEPGTVSYHPRPTTTSDDVIIGIIDTGTISSFISNERDTMVVV